jgi:hypothetical protein
MIAGWWPEFGASPALEATTADHAVLDAEEFIGTTGTGAATGRAEHSGGGYAAAHGRRPAETVWGSITRSGLAWAVLGAGIIAE